MASPQTSVANEKPTQALPGGFRNSREFPVSNQAA
jgi:hypothetical protein